MTPFQWPAPLRSASFSPSTGRRSRQGDEGPHEPGNVSAAPHPAAARPPSSRERGEGEGAKRFFANGNFYTADKRARFIAVRPPTAAARTTAEFPLVLNTGRVRDHWHTMTRTGRSQRLSQHLAEPYVEMHPADAERFGIAEADIVRVATERGEILVRALVSERQARGTIFVPMHWNDQFSAKARVDVLVPPLTDPVSGQPALKHVAVRIDRFQAAAYGFAVMRGRPERIEADYWAAARCAGGWRVELAFAVERDWASYAGLLLKAPPAAEMLAYQDRAARRRRFAWFEGGRLMGALFLAAEPVAIPRDWAVDQLAVEHAGSTARHGVIAGRPSAGLPDRGATVCSCFGVGANQIAAATRAGCATVAAIGEALQAGTNCGSCRGEIREIIDAHRLEAAE
jgi:assimilatory nitrate reductase catalytic subunit